MDEALRWLQRRPRQQRNQKTKTQKPTRRRALWELVARRQQRLNAHTGIYGRWKNTGRWRKDSFWLLLLLLLCTTLQLHLHQQHIHTKAGLVAGLFVPCGFVCLTTE